MVAVVSANKRLSARLEKALLHTVAHINLSNGILTRRELRIAMQKL
jgi:hypothetical protein